MGRYVSGEWDWKFAVGDQSSSFGEVLEIICSDCEDCYVDRYIGSQGQGEQVELHIENGKEFVERCKDFIGADFVVKDTTLLCQCKERFGEDYWNRLMIWKFLKDNPDLENYTTETMCFYVEY